jgi:lipopolysaccharide/colanic/teichoic acid biosynthesis glycosyltransferase
MEIAVSSILSIKAGVPTQLTTTAVRPVPSPALTLKRMTDIVGSAIGLVILAPLFGLVALAVRVDSRGPALYCGLRAGKDGRRFLCCKFRTMVVGADRMQEQLRAWNERQAPFFKITADPRLTRLGGFLRRYSVDEFPQLWNVLKGEMSLVGPRPHPEDDVVRYEPRHFRRLAVTPGMTGLWQIRARSDPSFERNMELDLEYIERWGLGLDFQILLKTLPAVLRGNGR